MLRFSPINTENNAHPIPFQDFLAFTKRYARASDAVLKLYGISKGEAYSRVVRSSWSFQRFKKIVKIVYMFGRMIAPLYLDTPEMREAMRRVFLRVDESETCPRHDEILNICEVEVPAPHRKDLEELKITLDKKIFSSTL